MKTAAEVRVSPDAETLAREAARYFIEIARDAAKQRGRFAVALSGGSTPKSLYSLLASAEFRDQVPWAQTHWFWGDERCVPPDDPQSNYRMVKEALLSKAPVPPSNVHRMAGEDAEPERAARRYEQELRTFFGGLPCLDLVLLGLGEEGHTASLFPGSPALEEQERWVVAPYVEKLKSHRLTLTLPVINAAANVAFLVAGAGKREILKQVTSSEGDLPAQQVRPKRGKLVWMADEAAVL